MVSGDSAGATSGEGMGTVRLSRAHAYTKARRHSILVRALKRAIPIISILSIVLMVGYAYFDPFRNMGGLTLGPISLSGSQITMQSPKLTGFRKDGQPYEVIASAATQDARQPTMVQLKDLRGKIATDDKGGIAHLHADSGYFDTQKENLNLQENVSVKMNNGQQILLNSAAIDFKAGTVISQEPVTVKLQSGTIEAQGLEVSENGKVLVFTGRVHSVFEKMPDDDSAPSGAEALKQKTEIEKPARATP